MLRPFVPIVGALLAAVVLFAAAALAQTAGPVLAGSYIGTFNGEGKGCNQGSVYAGPETGLEVNSAGTIIIGLLLTDLVTPMGDYGSITIPIDVPISEDGSFNQTFDPLSLGFTILHVDGQFDGESVSGNFSSTPPDGPGCAGTFTMEWVPPPPRTYRSLVGISEGGCGGGGIGVTVSRDGLSVIEIDVNAGDADRLSFSGTASFDEGSVPVAEGGSFGWVYFPGSEPGQEIAVLGRVDSGRLTGAITLSPSTCGAIPFVSAAPPALRGPLDGRGGPGYLPDTGSGGPAAASASLGWALAAGAFGFAALAAGAALRRKQR